MVPADEGHAVGVANFEAEEKEKRFEGVETAIDEVAHKKVVRVGGIPAHAEELHEVMELAVDVAAYRDWRVDRDDVAFLD